MNGRLRTGPNRLGMGSVGLLGTLLFGCNASMPTADLPFTNPSEQLITTLGEPDGAGHATLRSDDKRIPRSTVNLTAPNSVIVHARTERYLKDLLAQLLKNVPENLKEDKEIDVFLTSHNGSAHLYATGADDILVGYGSLTWLRSRDELAFALSHELAHVLLGHNHGQETIFSMDTAIKLADEALMMGRTFKAVYKDGPNAKQLTPEQQRQLNKSISEIRIAAGGLRATVTGVLHGAWSRSQERDADRLGYDILVAAGFNGEGAGRLLDRFGEEPSLRDEVAKHIDKMEKAANDLVSITDQGYQLYFKQLGISGAAKGVKALLATLDDTHEAAAERKRELYEDYVDELDLERNLDRLIDDTQYKRDMQRIGFIALKGTVDLAKKSYQAAVEGERPPATAAIVSGRGSHIGFNRFALYEVRKEAKHLASAVKNLQIAWTSRPADFSTASEYAVQLASKGKVDNALKIADFLESTYTSDAPFNDLRGRIYESAGDVKQAKQLWNTCDTNRKSYVRQRCEYELDRLQSEEEQVALEQQLKGTPQLAGDDPSTAYPPPAAGAASSSSNPSTSIMDKGLDKIKGLLGITPEESEK